MLIEEYAIVSDTHTAAVVGKDGSIDWLCLPRFDAGACFAALLGEPRHGRFRLAPHAPIVRATRRYRPDTLVLETDLETAEGAVRIIDFMPVRDEVPDLVRIVVGLSGRVTMGLDLIVRFDYGDAVPWVRRIDGRLLATAGPDALVLCTPIVTHGEGLTTRGDFTVAAGEQVPLVLTWFPSHRPVPDSTDAFEALARTETWWRAWAARCTHRGAYRDDVVRSLVTLKALTYEPTGGIVAAATTSLPETLGGERNWDYRFCWLRDATFTLYAMMQSGYVDEAAAWRDWLLRAAAGDVSRLQPLYGPAGERWLGERTLPWLPGYEGSRPVRIGNAAVGQLQLDIYGEVIDTLYQARRCGIACDGDSWALERALIECLEKSWSQPDHGLWEVRGPQRHFTHSKVMAWVALDRAVKTVEQHGQPGDAARWAAARNQIHAEVCARAWNPTLNSFAQSYGADIVDASLLLLPQVGFLPAEDPRIAGTVAAIEHTLLDRGFVRRYPRLDASFVDGLAGTEGAFLACSFWLVDAYVLLGRRGDAQALFERLLAVRNDVGLLSEEYDVDRGRLVGNFPQAFSHVALVNSARNLATEAGPAAHRAET